MVWKTKHRKPENNETPKTIDFGGRVYDAVALRRLAGGSNDILFAALQQKRPRSQPDPTKNRTNQTKKLRR